MLRSDLALPSWGECADCGAYGPLVAAYGPLSDPLPDLLCAACDRVAWDALVDLTLQVTQSAYA